MAKEDLKKAFSVGFTCYEMTMEQFRDLVVEFSEYINDVYFSPPYGPEYHTRPRINEALPPRLSVEKKMFKCLHAVAAEGIKLNLALNTGMPATEEVVASAERICDNLPVYSITTLFKHMDELQTRFPDLKYKCSYNVGIKNIKDALRLCRSKKFDQVVLGNSGMRDRGLWKFIDENGVEVIHMPNNGCTLRCNYYCNAPYGGACGDQFYDTLDLEGMDLEKLYAEQSIFPWEFHEYLLDAEHISHFKISSRTSTYEILRLCLKSYIENINRPIIDRHRRFYYIWGRMGHLSDNKQDYDYDRLCNYKRKLWNGEVLNTYKKYGIY